MFVKVLAKQLTMVRHDLLLSERERRFVEAFMGPAKGNGAAAARIAGYARRSARVTASRLLTKANIRRAIEVRVQGDPLVATREQLQQFWSAIVQGRGAYVLLEWGATRVPLPPAVSGSRT